MITVAVITAGGIGAGVRYVASGVVQTLDGRFPVGTLFVNASGSFLIGLAAGVADPGSLGRVIAFGFLGGYTTFSTWAFESLALARTGQRKQALLNMTITLVIGVALCALGFQLTD